MNKKLLRLFAIAALAFSTNTFAKNDSPVFSHEYSPSVHNISAFEADLMTDLEATLGETMEKLLKESMDNIKRSIQFEYNQQFDLVTESKKKKIKAPRLTD